LRFFKSVDAGLVKLREMLAGVKKDADAANNALAGGVAPFSLGQPTTTPANLERATPYPADELLGMTQPLKDQLELMGALGDKERELIRIDQEWLALHAKLGTITGLNNRDWAAAIDLINRYTEARKAQLVTEEQGGTFVAGIKKSVDAIREQFSPENLGMTTVTTLTNAWSGFFNAMTFGSQRASDAFKAMARQILSQAAAMANNFWISQLIGGIAGGIGLSTGGGSSFQPSGGSSVGGSYTWKFSTAKGLTDTARDSGTFTHALQSIAKGGLY
jgi:hypothetical protein